MRYWFTIKASLTEEQGRELWDKVSKYKANLTLLPERTDIYGDSDGPEIPEAIAKIIVDAGYPAERGGIMTISHMKMLLKQDADMAAVKEIVAAYDGAKLDDDNYIVYYNTEPQKVSKLIEELHTFKYSVEITNEVF